MCKVDLGPDSPTWEAIERIAIARAEGNAEAAARAVCNHYGPQRPRPIFGTALLAKRRPR